LIYFDKLWFHVLALSEVQGLQRQFYVERRCGQQNSAAGGAHWVVVQGNFAWNSVQKNQLCILYKIGLEDINIKQWSIQLATIHNQSLCEKAAMF
jgi:hypothetical protein